MKKEKRDKHFIHTPKYPGGKKAFGDFIRNNLKYPEDALKNKIEGKVYLSFQVNDMGEVISAQVIHGLGFGCDEEALRIVRLLKYEKVVNRGLRLISTVKTHIEFKLPVKIGFQYTIVSGNAAKETPPEKKEGGNKYGYTIKY